MPEQLLTLEQVADYLNVDKFTVYRLIADRELPAFKVGNQWRFKKKLIENRLERNSNFQRKLPVNYCFIRAPCPRVHSKILGFFIRLLKSGRETKRGRSAA